MFTTMQEIATVLDHTDDAASFAASAAAIKKAFNAAFYDASLGYYAGIGDSGYRQSHNILAVAFNLTEDAEMAQAVADSVVKDVTERGMHLNTGALSTKFLLPVLTAHEHLDAALAVAQQTTFPSWGFWIENGATTTVISSDVHQFFTHPLFRSGSTGSRTHVHGIMYVVTKYQAVLLIRL
jgi:alpha-L-rhamnosidase